MLHNLVGHLLNVALDLSVLVLAPDEALGGEEGVLGVDDGLTLGGDTNEPLAIGGEADDRRGSARA
jgi:hypothetical protein